MKTNPSKHLSYLLSLAIGLGLSAEAFARSENPFENSLARRNGGGVQGGGGDVVTERRIKEIRDHLADFIERGGHRELDFKNRLTLAEYESGSPAKGIYGMKLVLQEGAVTVNVIRREDEDLSDELRNTRVNGARKICKGVFSAQVDGLPYLICEAESFNQMDSDPEKNTDLQTVQIAHEYHSLAGIEQNYGSDSVYWLSDQLRAHMGYETVRRLVVGQKRPILSPNPVVQEIRRTLKAKGLPFSKTNHSRWDASECRTYYLTGETTTDPYKFVGNASWVSFPGGMFDRGIEFKHDLAGHGDGEIERFYTVADGPRLFFTAIRDVVRLKLDSRGVTLSGDFGADHHFIGKVGALGQLVIEVSMPVYTYLGKSIRDYGISSVFDEERAPYVYMICKRN